MAGWPGFFKFGEIIDERYRIEEILGAGGAGVTYRCVDMLCGEETALKILHADRERGTLANRLLIEGECLELLEHEHIVPFRALRIVGQGPYYLATLHMRGGSLDRQVKRHGPLSPAGTLELGRQLALALDFVHAGGIVHRDLKPANVLLEVSDSDAPVARLADFGIARLYRDPRPILGGLTRTGAFIGTPEYAAPEQIRGEQGVGPAADAFAFGALLHFTASGTPLLRRDAISDWDEFRQRRWDPSMRPRLSDVVEAADDDAAADLALLDDVIDTLMHPTPRQRIDLATAAMRFGADPGLLARRDSPSFAPPSLTGEYGDESFEDLDPEALLPGAPTGEDTAPTRLPVQLSPIHDRTDDEDIEIEWPTREQRRNRRHGLALVAAALLAGTAFAWPGGPAALLGPDAEGMLGRFAESLSAAAPSYTLSDPRVAPDEEAAVADAGAQSEPASTQRRDVRRAGVVPLSQRQPRTRAKPEVTPKARTTPAPPVVAQPTRRRLEPSESSVTSDRPVADAGPATAEEASGIDPSAVEAWASDPRDDRSLGDVLEDQEELSRLRWRDDLARAAVEADERAAGYRMDAELEDARRAELRDRWEDVQSRSREDREADRTDNAETEDPVPAMQPVELPSLDEIFDRPKVDPLAQSARD